MNAKNLEIQEERQEQWNPTSTAWNFFFLSREFSKIHSETFLTISFLCCFRISRIMNAKKSRNSRGKTRAMETHFYTMQFLFSFTRTFLWTCRAIPYYFSLSPVSISRIKNAKTISKFEREPLRMYNPVLLFKLRILSLNAALSSSQHSLALWYERICMCGVYTTWLFRVTLIVHT